MKINNFKANKMNSRQKLFFEIFLIMISHVLSGNTPVSCDSFTDCFNCTATDEAICIWNSGKCSSTTYTVTDSQFYSICKNDAAGYKTIQKYCGDDSIFLNDSEEGSVSVPLIDGHYGLPYLVCKYTYNNGNGKKNIFFNLTVEEEVVKEMSFSISATFSDGSVASRKPDSTNYGVQINGAKEASLLVIFDSSSKVPPFELQVKLKNKSISVTLIATIVLIVIACIICGISIYLFSKRIARQRQLARENQGRFQMMGIGMQGNVINQQRSHEQIKEKRKKQIEEILSKELRPRKYSEDIGKYNISCTICLEDYNQKSLISVTKCNHVFHYECITKWLHENILEPRCPNCNLHLLPEIENNENVQEHVSRFVPQGNHQGNGRNQSNRGRSNANNVQSSRDIIGGGGNSSSNLNGTESQRLQYVADPNNLTENQPPDGSQGRRRRRRANTENP